MLTRLRTYGSFYLTGGCFAVWLKYTYSQADCGELLWILRPVACWAGWLCGLPFTYEEGVGYVNHSIRFIIAPSCSGVQFLIIAVLMLLFAFLHRMRTWKKSIAWMLLSLAAAYGYTMFVNGIRITAAIYLPALVEHMGWRAGWLTPERLHTMIGVTVYFAALLLLYRAADAVLCAAERTGNDKKRDPVRQNVPGGKLQKEWPYYIPTFWYLLIVLGLPFLNRAAVNNRKAYMEYAVLTAAVCAAMLGVVRLGKRVWGVVKRLYGN